MYGKPVIGNETLNASLQYNQLVAALCNAKNNKRPGDHRIPNNFFKNTPDTFLMN